MGRGCGRWRQGCPEEALAVDQLRDGDNGSVAGKSGCILGCITVWVETTRFPDGLDVKCAAERERERSRLLKDSIAIKGEKMDSMSGRQREEGFQNYSFLTLM